MDSVLIGVDVGAWARAKAGREDSSETAAQAASQQAGPLPVMLQADFAATVAPMLGLPGPFANVGRLHRGLFRLAGESAGLQPAAERANAQQVWRYLEAYQAAGSFPSDVASELRRVYERIESFSDAATGNRQEQRVVWDAVGMPLLLSS